MGLSGIPRLPAPSTEYRGIGPESSIVRVIAVAGVIFGTLGMACMPFSFGAFETQGWPLAGMQHTTHDGWFLASIFIELGLSPLLLFSSLGCYHFKWWGRYGLLFWAFCTAVYGAAGLYFWVYFLIPTHHLDAPAMRGVDEVAPLLGWIVGSGLSIFVLIFLPRPSIRAVFVPSESH